MTIVWFLAAIGIGALSGQPPDVWVSAHTDALLVSLAVVLAGDAIGAGIGQLRPKAGDDG